MREKPRKKGTRTTMTTQYLSYGIVGGRTHSDRELERLRTVELVRAAARRHRLRRLLGR
jgi:hypothetical protein